MSGPRTTPLYRVFFVYCLVFLLAIAGTFAAVQKLARPSGESLVPQPAFDYSEDYGPPYNVTVTCTHTGAPGVLDPNVAPAAGDRLVRDCVVTELPSQGSPIEPLVG